jgi:hypothetical protein
MEFTEILKIDSMRAGPHLASYHSKFDSSSERIIICFSIIKLSACTHLFIPEYAEVVDNET